MAAGASAPLGGRPLRSLFLSDMHLGARGCRVDRIIDFLKSHDAETIYLVGDIFDSRFPVRTHWSADHDGLLQVVMERVRQGRRIVYIPGNHDSVFRRHCGVYFDNIAIVERAVHVTASGARFLVVHGDCFDVVAMNARWLATLGGHLDRGLRNLSARLNWALRLLGLAERSLMDLIHPLLNSLVTRGDLFGHRVSALAASHGATGVICGHFHRAAIHEEFGITYINCGDWTDCCTAVAEEADGRMRMINWKNPAAAAIPQHDAFEARATTAGA